MNCIFFDMFHQTYNFTHTHTRNRDEYLERARQHEEDGNRDAAYTCYQRCVDICPELAACLITELKKRDIEFVVAPYEADAQVYMRIYNMYFFCL